MSINFSDEVNDEIITTAASLPEDRAEGSLRPRTLAEYIGQEKAKENLTVFINAAKMRGESLDHVLLHGPPGLGKTTLAAVIANEMGVSMRITSGPAIEKPGDLVAMLTNLNEGDILFVDEIHRLNRAYEEILYPAMEDYAIDIILGKGPSANSLHLDLPHFTLIGATTRSGQLTAPLRDRFGVTLRLELYTPEELQRIVQRSAGILNVRIVGPMKSPRARAARPGSQTVSCAGSATTRRYGRTASSRALSRTKPSPASRSTSSAWTRSTAGCCAASSNSTAEARSGWIRWPRRSTRRRSRWRTCTSRICCSAGS